MWNACECVRFALILSESPLWRVAYVKHLFNVFSDTFSIVDLFEAKAKEQKKTSQRKGEEEKKYRRTKCIFETKRKNVQSIRMNIESVERKPPAVTEKRPKINTAAAD